METHVTHFCQSEHPHNNNSTGGKRISNVQSYVWKLQIWLLADFPPFGSCSCWGTKQLLQMGFISPRSDVEVRFGEHDIWEVDGTEQHIMSAEFIRHPDYDSRTQDSDIMLIKLSRPATFNAYVRPALLPTKCASDGTKCQVSGWGSLRSSDEGCESHTGRMTLLL